MTHDKRFRFGMRVLTACLPMLLAGCAQTMPEIDAATFRAPQTGGLRQARALDGTQLRALNAWMARHDAGWKPSQASYAPIVVIEAHRIDGKTSSVYLSRTVVAIGTDKQQYARNLTPTEYAEISGILSAATVGAE